MAGRRAMLFVTVLFDERGWFVVRCGVVGDVELYLEHGTRQGTWGSVVRRKVRRCENYIGIRA
jgi:hypothetical protein